MPANTRSAAFLSLPIAQNCQRSALVVYELHQHYNNVTEPIGRNEVDLNDIDSFLRREIYYPVLDKAVGELAKRFSTETIGILLGLDAFNPSHASFMKFDVVQPFALHYEANMEDLEVEMRQMARIMERKRADGSLPTPLRDSATPLLEFHNFCTSYKDAFYEMYKLLQIACTIPVSSSEAERSFSCLKLIETHLRTTMAEQRLSDLAVLSIHKDRAKKINLD